jgi:hypothetical protein
MSTQKYIGSSPGVNCGDMICSKCKEHIGDEEYLIVEHNISKRGNENDYN